ncbi:MAG: ABC-2 transporter permease, partial [Oscillospiraceae bacterium]|nr:ABC-2 transporter permease [Oscillospiraceae bacterium]
IALLAAGGLLVPAVLLPFTFRFGMEKGRIVYLLTVGLSLGGFAALGAVKGTNLSGLNMTDGLAAGLLAAAVIAFIISWRLSIILYKTRELA